MRGRGALAAGATALCLSLGAPAVGAAVTEGQIAVAPAGAVGEVYISGGGDVTLDGTPRVSWSTAYGQTYDVELARARDDDPALGAWEPAVTGGAADGAYPTTVGRGRVVCARVRIHSDTNDAPWSVDCAVRPRDDAAFTVVGGHQEVRVRGSGGRATRLLGDGRLLVPDLVTGDRVAAIYSYGRWSELDGARWRRPDGSEGLVATGDFSESTLTYAVTTAGTGRFFASPGLGTRPIAGIARIPAWFTPQSASYGVHDGTTLTNSTPATPNGGTYRLVSPNGSVQLRWFESTFANVSPQLQLATGSVLGGHPIWRDRPVPQFAGAVRITVPQGSATCSRVRWRRDDGLTSAWSRAWCVTRPFDDSRLSYRGGYRTATDPASADGRSRRMDHGASYRLPHLRRGSLFGFLYYDEPTHADGTVVIEPGIGLDGRAPSTLTGFAADAPTPSAWWAVVRRPDTVGIIAMPRTGNPVVRLSGVLVIPRWAR